jgi:hypothetical protein
MTVDDFFKESIDYWKGFFDGWVDDLPDGAWFQVHVDSFEGDALKDCCEALELDTPEGDGNDLMQGYLAALDPE